MASLSDEQAAYVKGIGIADVLLSRGVPVLSVIPMDCGSQIGMLFQLSGERAKYGARLPTEEASVERFTELYEAVK